MSAGACLRSYSFIVGGNDEIVLKLKYDAMRGMKAKTELKIIPGASHLLKSQARWRELRVWLLSGLQSTPSLITEKLKTDIREGTGSILADSLSQLLLQRLNLKKVSDV